MTLTRLERDRLVQSCRNGVVWYGMVWCGMKWNGVVWSSVVWCGVVWGSGSWMKVLRPG